MDTEKAVELFEKNWFLRDREKPELTPAERQLVAAAMGPAPKRWDGTPDVGRMEEILAAEPQVLDRIGGHLLQVVAAMRGCGPAVTFLIERGVPLEIEESAYNVLHEAAWGGMEDTLRAVFESGAADATCVSVLKPHVGWPDNISLMYWAACGGHVECARLLIRYGRRRSPRAADQGERREGDHLPSGSGRPEPLGEGPFAAGEKACGCAHPHRGRGVLRRLFRLRPQRHRPPEGADRRGGRGRRRRRGVRHDAASLGGARRLE